MLVLVCVSLAIVRPVLSALEAPSIAAKGEVAARVIVVDQSGVGDFRTVNEAFDAVPLHNKDPVTIKVNPGTYLYATPTSSVTAFNFKHSR